MSTGESLEQVVVSDAVPVETLKAAIAGEPPVDLAVREEYARQLLMYALNNRDIEAGNLVAGAMDADPALDEALDSLLNDMLYEKPDAVYAFVRAHLAANLNPHWLSRLKIAAIYSLRVAINDASSETIVNWLTLIAREPQTYELNEVLHYSILATQMRAHDDPELARQLVLMAARRDPASLDVLLEDTTLLNALPNNIGQVLRDYSGDALILLQNKGVEIFLVGLARAAHAHAGTMLTPAVVAHLWETYISGQGMTLPEHYRPEAIIRELIASGAEFLTSDTIETLVILMLESRRDDLAFALLEQEKNRAILMPVLLDLLGQSGRTPADQLALIAQMVNDGYLPPQEAVENYQKMLRRAASHSDLSALAQQFARTLQQNTTVDVPFEVLWNLLDLAAEGKDELVARVVVKRLLTDARMLEDEGELIEILRRVSAQTQWSETLRQMATAWWREFLREQPLVRLGRLDKALDGKKGLEDERGILQTLSIIRKMLGQRTLQEFANDVRAAYTVLEVLAESFDNPARRALNFDSPIARAELDTRGDQITPQERQILANNLKELAQIIAQMGDNRTRPNLMRRSEDLDRDLMTNQQSPHSGLDTMKWLSGYWGGAQNGEKQEES